ncbi:glycosyl transferase family 2 [Cohnella sp. CIP 111063]|jgi:4,4'-diaponeurosporenoate glycosyltransferase|uniref:glycosyltransferase n=1 Tax=unclassified Cohnella TaxID=2636738 RepID=UPI000B8C3DB3|nr:MULTISPECIES: glycosyltransferase [unclassified Cohnella]OXS56341.1 glycosyl transferase family 2 [Cohnella sp. CIP 111063]PRX67962.1 glycosyltransferase involved in cell wall biosynthesis [Cohnella sp. SGD-V74]
MWGSVWIWMVVSVGCASGFLLFRRVKLPVSGNPGSGDKRVTVIIPARNEESNLPHLLASLMEQTARPHEIIVVDDHSKDRTRQIAESYGVSVMTGSPLPEGWTGKNWAVWNGYLRASGDVLVFLDADVRLAPNALASLLRARERSGGVVSVVPYHRTQKLYERLALVFNLLGAFAFTSPFERNNPRKGLYGSCIVAAREDYERINGHESVKSEVLDDLLLGSKFREAGIPTANYLGYRLVSFRMYPQGIRSEIEGFSKGAVLSTSTLNRWTVVCSAAWTAGLLVSESALLTAFTPWALPLAMGYVLYTVQLLYLMRYVGFFGIVVPLLHPLAVLFFLIVMLYSLYQVAVLGRVRWKGRDVRVGSGRRR